MPDVVGESLEVALNDIEGAGVDDEVEILGGGVLGIVDESNWQVCEQLPPAGDEVTDVPRLTVDRECEALAEAAPSTAPGDEESETDPEQPDDSAALGVLTPENSEDLAALLAGPGECGDDVADFADKYRGRDVEFDGNIAFMNNHDDYDTRFDFLIYAGDYSEESARGPSFQISNANFGDLHVTGADSVKQGDNIHIIATVEEFTSGCLLRLDPVATEVR